MDRIDDGGIDGGNNREWTQGKREHGSQTLGNQQ